jgi:nucleoside-diphosphate-sugar epimerase
LNIVLEHVYGPYDNPNKFVEYMIRKIAIEKVNSLDLTLGEQLRDFVYIEDVCDAYIKLLEYSGKNNFKFCTFDIGYGESILIREFITEIKRLSKSPTKLMLGSIPYRQNEIMFSKGSGKVSDINFIPKYNYAQGIKKIINIYLRKG